MAKYSFEFKKEIVTAYKNGEGGCEDLAKKYGVKASSKIMNWVKAYDDFGEEGLLRVRKMKKYSVQVTLMGVEGKREG